MRTWKKLSLGLFGLSAAFAWTGCMTETEIQEKVVVVGGPDTALLNAEGQTLKLCFLGRFGTDTLRTGRKYLTAGGDSVRFEMARFYVSQIALVDSTGKSHPLIGTHLVDMLDSGAQARGYAYITLKALPGTYRGVRFTVGVPFDQNHADPATQAAPLGTESDMFWSWNSGYIFNRTEGKVDSAGTEKAIAYHIGEDIRALDVNLFSLTGTVTSFTVAGGHHKVAAAAKTAHEVESHYAVNVAYDKIFLTGLNTSSPLKPSLNANERQAHGGAIADRVFLNMKTMFTAADAAPSGGGHH